jgi:hypothetical protein
VEGDMERALIEAEKRILEEKRSQDAELSSKIMDKYGIVRPEYNSKQQKEGNNSMVTTEIKRKRGGGIRSGVSRANWKTIMAPISPAMLDSINRDLERKPWMNRSNWIIEAIDFRLQAVMLEKSLKEAKSSSNQTNQ